MQLPFTVVFEPPRWAPRAWWAWLLIAVLATATASVLLFLFILSPHAGAAADASATLVVDSQPGGATVEIDGRARGITPLTLSVAPGEHRVTLRRPGYADATHVVRAEANSTATTAGELWLRSPEVRRLRPTYPGTTIADATFLDDGGLALTVALPPDDGRQLWLLDAQGGARRLGPTTARGSIAASPDGSRVAYLAASERSGRGGPTDEVWLSATSGDRGERRFALPTGDERLVDLSWAPDGRRLLIVGRQRLAGGGQHTRLRLLDATTGEARELVSLPSAVVPGSVAWSPDGARLGLLTQVGQVTSLCVLDADGGFRYLTDLGRDQSTPLAFPPLAWSPDGARLLYAAPAQERSAASGWLFGPRAGPALFAAEAAQPLARRAPYADGHAPVWRTDGSVLALARTQGGTLVLRDVGGGREPRDVVELPIRAGATFAARWDASHAQAVVAVPAAAGLGASQPDYWLVRFRPEAER